MIGEILLGSPRSLFLNFLPQKNRRGFLRFSLGRNKANRPLRLSSFGEKLKNILYVLPEDPVEALLQMPVLRILQKSFPQARAALFCQGRIADFIQGCPGVPKTFSYSSQATRPFSRAANNWVRLFRRQEFSACFLLDRQPDTRCAFLCASAGIPLRIAHATPDSEIFCNLTIRRRPQGAFVTEQNLSLVKCLGLPFSSGMEEWRVSEALRQSMQHFLRELGWAAAKDSIALSADTHPRVAETLVPRILQKGGQVVVMSALGQGKTKASWEKNGKNVFVCPPLPLGELAAALALCRALIATKSLLLYLACQLGIPAIGMFEGAPQPEWVPRHKDFHVIQRQGNAASWAEQAQVLLGSLK